MYNPDYPTNDCGGTFFHYNCQPQQMMNYWNGSSVIPNAYMNPYIGMDSRRNEMVNPVNPFGTFGQTQMNQQYPMNGTQSGTMQMGNASGGLNGLINESRRNTPQNNVTNNNPWAPQQTQQNMNNQMSPQYPGIGQMGSPYGYYGMSCYNPSPVFFDGNNCNKRNTNGIWNNGFAQNKAIPMPMPPIDWRQQANQNNPYQCQMQPQYPMQQITTVQQNWKDIAEKNWKNSNI